MKANLQKPFAQPTGCSPRRLRTLFGLGALLASLVAPVRGAEEAAVPSEKPLFRFGFSAKAFAGVNENDAKASLKVWAQTVTANWGFEADPVAKVFRDASGIQEALRARTVDAIVVSTPDYFALAPDIRPGQVMTQKEHAGDSYQLLVSANSGITNLAGLRGATLNLHDSFQTSLAKVWLDGSVLQTTSMPADRFFGNIQAYPKPSGAVLPVFFGNADACLVSSRAFETLAELNPQVKKRLRVVERSPTYLAVVVAFRNDLDPALARQVRDALIELHTTPAGAQMLALFHGRPVTECPISALDSAREALVLRERLLRECVASGEGRP